MREDVYGEWAKGNLRPGAELFAPEVSFEPMSDGRVPLGRGEIEGYMREFLAQWSDFRVEAEEMTEFGETILVTERQRATGLSSGLSAEMVNYATWTFRDGLVVRVRWDLDRDSAMRSAGLL